MLHCQRVSIQQWSLAPFCARTATCDGAASARKTKHGTEHPHLSPAQRWLCCHIMGKSLHACVSSATTLFSARRQAVVRAKQLSSCWMHNRALLTALRLVSQTLASEVRDRTIYPTANCSADPASPQPSSCRARSVPAENNERKTLSQHIYEQPSVEAGSNTPRVAGQWPPRRPHHGPRRDNHPFKQCWAVSLVGGNNRPCPSRLCQEGAAK